MDTGISITVEGNPVSLEDREYSGVELRGFGGLADADKLVRENEDGTETPVPVGKKVRPRSGESYYRSVRHRRG